MNERIKELIEHATEHDYTTWDSYNQKELVYYKFNKEKFAELIVDECCLKLLDMDEKTKGNHNYYKHAALEIKKHFRVEE